MPLTDEELQVMPLREVPDSDLPRWEKLYLEKYHPPKEAPNASKTMSEVSPGEDV